MGACVGRVTAVGSCLALYPCAWPSDWHGVLLCGGVGQAALCGHFFFFLVLA